MKNLDIKVPKGKYILAVSGGVDSMVLLDVLSKQKDLALIVAHLDHGLREDSFRDAELVKRTASKYKLPFISEKLAPEEKFSEEKARKSRYEFLRKVMNDHEAIAIITAHHQNDQLETAIFNLLRGTGRKGLSSLKSTELLVRPLIGVSKEEIYKYAKANNIRWNEDSTNSDTKYKRNYIRHKLIPKLGNDKKQQLIDLLSSASKTNESLDSALETLIKQITVADNALDKTAYIMLPHSLAREVMATWLRQNNIRDFDKKHLDQLTIAPKTLKPGRQIDVNLTHVLSIKKESLALEVREC